MLSGSFKAAFRQFESYGFLYFSGLRQFRQFISLLKIEINYKIKKEVIFTRLSRLKRLDHFLLLCTDFHMDPAEATHGLPISAGKIFIIGQPQCFCILIQILLEGILCPGSFQIVLAPFPVGSVKPPGTGIGSVFPSHVSGRIQE